MNAGVSGGARASIGGGIAITGGVGGKRLMIGHVMGSKLKKQGDTDIVTDDSDTDGVAYQNLFSDGLIGTYTTKTHILGKLSLKKAQNFKAEKGSAGADTGFQERGARITDTDGVSLEGNVLRGTSVPFQTHSNICIKRPNTS